MSRYIDADKLTVYFEALAKQAEMEGLYNMAHIHNRCLKIIEDAPTADVVEVVRCKDCIARPQKYLEPFVCARNNILVYGNSFCSYGKRRSENEG
jgi:hypothetical protein